ncbi:methionine--tRNA ligase [Streptomyces sp. J2-1]|uniref:methionine--tRNA ligase n=1 Tax=Streptomyces corallincola TaxID=2851888 RepID=UPI001C384551|nr:methionine--tRNA ligase [Streptomyces corallincola]MBV2354146.1 methionine--tRNA ligase [Streptomyces corallincola]
MDTSRHYLTTTIPYVNARPHLGFALELVQADALARHHRLRGREVRLVSGTDDNSLKNVLAAEAAGTDVQAFVDGNAAAFAALAGPLSLSLDDFVRTSGAPRHRAGVEELWRRCAASGDLYRRAYEGLYCVGCEQFYSPAELDGGCCPEHGTEPQRVAEENWFFRLSRYADRLRELIGSGALRVEPATRRNEVLALIDGGLRDFSVSRSRERARGWGIPVPGDPTQVVYVWWDALGSYVTGLGFGTEGPAFEHWWASPGRRTHLLGKGVLRFHAVYWPALLLSAGLPLPTDLLVHGYLTVDGRKIGKSAGNGVDPTALVAAYGTDAVRWWLLREVPRSGDTDFSVDRLVDRADADFAGGVGNLVHRVVTALHRFRGGVVPSGPSCLEAPAAVGALAEGCGAVSRLVDEALAAYDFRRALGAVWAVVEEANRCVDAARPWELARAERAGDAGAGARLDHVLRALVAACGVLAEELRPFVPDAAERIRERLTPVGGRLPVSRPLFGRLRTEGG